MRDLILQLTKISIYSTKPSITGNQSWRACTTSECVGWGYASPRTCCTRWTCPDTRQFRGTVSACWMRQVCLQRSELITCEGTVIYCPPPIQSMGLPHQILLSTQSRKSYFFLRRCLDPALHFDARRMLAPHVQLLLFASWWYSAAAGRSNLLSNGIRSR